MTAAEFCALLMSRGLTLSDIDRCNTGFLIDLAREHDRIQARKHGIELPDPYKEYLQLKEMEPEIEELYAAGEIKEYKYKSYRETLDRYEEQLRG